MREIPKTGEHYRHFKGNEYIIMNIAKDTETGVEQVVYQDATNAYNVFVRPLDMFLSEVDREKYPDVTQKYRFEKVEPRMKADVTEAIQIDPRLLEFLDAKEYNQKLEVLKKMEGDISEKLVEDMAVCLDFQLNEGTLEEKFESIKQCLLTLENYEGSRLRF